MAKFHLHMRMPSGEISDVEGADFPNLGAAIAEAIASAQEMLAEWLRRGDGLIPMEIVITNEIEIEVAIVGLDRFLQPR
jgi:hypothetical protein